MNWRRYIHSSPNLRILCERLIEMDHTVDDDDLWSKETEINHCELPIFGGDRPAADAPHMEIFSWDDTHELIRAHGVWTIRERELDPTERIIIETQEYLVRTTGEFPVFTDDDVPEFARCACR
jgi:hypothetical protein